MDIPSARLHDILEMEMPSGHSYLQMHPNRGVVSALRSASSGPADEPAVLIHSPSFGSTLVQCSIVDVLPFNKT